MAHVEGIGDQERERARVGWVVTYKKKKIKRDEKKEEKSGWGTKQTKLALS